MKNQIDPLVPLIAQTIYDKKGMNIIALDVKGISSITDYIVVAEGNVDRHIVAIAEAIEKAGKALGEKPIYIEGKSHGDWIVIDFVQVMVHLFVPGLREKYQLERLWSEGSLIELELSSQEKLAN